MRQLIVAVPVVAHLLNLVHADTLLAFVLLAGFHLLRVVVSVGAEAADLYLAGRHGPLRVDNDGQIGLVHPVLMQFLVVNIDT